MQWIQKGFVALTITVVLSAGLLLLAGAGSLRSWYARSNMLDVELKRQSEVLAATCVAHVQAWLAENPLYAGDTTFAQDDGTCSIGLVHGGAEKTVMVVGEYRGAQTALVAMIDATTMEVVSEKEIRTY